MHFSTLVLFIILPAAAYAAVYPEQFPVGPKYGCLPPGKSCDAFSDPCCAGFSCVEVGPIRGNVLRCLSLIEWNIRYAPKSATVARFGLK